MDAVRRQGGVGWGGEVAAAVELEGRSEGEGEGDARVGRGIGVSGLCEAGAGAGRGRRVEQGRSGPRSSMPRGRGRAWRKASVGWGRAGQRSLSCTRRTSCCRTLLGAASRSNCWRLPATQMAGPPCHCTRSARGRRADGAAAAARYGGRTFNNVPALSKLDVPPATDSRQASGLGVP